MSIQFSFKEKRSTQAAAFLIKRNDNSLNYMKLIKLLYLADREALTRWQESITGDRYFSLSKGPIVSAILDKIVDPPDPNNPDYWSSAITKTDHDPYAVTVIKDVGTDELSAREIELLESIDDFFKSYSQWDMVEYCHTYLPEWKDPGNTRLPITIEDIFEVVFKNNTSEEKEHFLDIAAFKAGIDQLTLEVLHGHRR